MIEEIKTPYNLFSRTLDLNFNVNHPSKSEYRTIGAENGSDYGIGIFIN
jgi:hypothetical protein